MSGSIPPRWPSSESDPTPLGKPMTFPYSNRTVKNRFLKAATSEHLSSFDPTNVEAHGIPSSAVATLYGRWGRGGWGMITTGNIMINPEHLEGPKNAIIPPRSPFSGPRFEAFQAIPRAAKAHVSGGPLIVGQLSHPGRSTPNFVQSRPISASAVPLVAPHMPFSFADPYEATHEEIAEVVEGFAFAAEYLERAGFDGVEIHGAHGYLIAQFLSPRTNRRTDEYGGSLENRTRLALEVAAAIKKRVGKDFIMGMKVTSVEFQDDGFSPEEAVLLCQALENAGFDYVETSGGSYENMALEHRKESTVKRENYFVEFAEQIARGVTKTKVYTTGGLKTVGGMLSTLSGVDGIGMARVSFQEPSFPDDILSGKITGSMKLAIGDNDFGALMTALGCQMQRLSHGEEPVDLTDPAVVKAILETAQGGSM